MVLEMYFVIVALIWMILETSPVLSTFFFFIVHAENTEASQCSTLGNKKKNLEFMLVGDTEYLLSRWVLRKYWQYPMYVLHNMCVMVVSAGKTNHNRANKRNTRASHVAPHHSTNLAQLRLTSRNGRNVVLSTWYGGPWGFYIEHHSYTPASDPYRTQ